MGGRNREVPVQWVVVIGRFHFYFILDMLPVQRTTSKPIQKLNNMNFQTGKY